jgi:hypothetical protein
MVRRRTIGPRANMKKDSSRNIADATIHVVRFGLKAIVERNLHRDPDERQEILGEAATPEVCN